jgi:hypothetical protein
MEITNIHSIANSRGIKTDNLFKHEVIKAIQTAEGNFDCYGTARNGVCDQVGCAWLGDCIEVSTQLDTV